MIIYRITFHRSDHELEFIVDIKHKEYLHGGDIFSLFGDSWNDNWLIVGMEVINAPLDTDPRPEIQP